MIPELDLGHLYVLNVMSNVRLHSYPVLHERAGDLVAHFRFTVLLLPSGPTRITGLPFTSNLSSDKTIDSELAALMALSTKKKKRKKKTKTVRDTSGS